MTKYQQSFRPNYELWAAGIWSLFIALGWLAGQASPLPKVFLSLNDGGLRSDGLSAN